jgi:hypothetical protein
MLIDSSYVEGAHQQMGCEMRTGREGRRSDMSLDTMGMSMVLKMKRRLQKKRKRITS